MRKSLNFGEIDGVEINTNYSIDLTSCKISPILPIQVYKLGEKLQKKCIYKQSMTKPSTNTN